MGVSINSLTLAHEDRAAVAVFHAVPVDATVRVERMSAKRGWDLQMIEAGEFDDESYHANPVNRGGSGNLNRWAEWSFCLTAARMVAEQERR